MDYSSNATRSQSNWAVNPALRTIHFHHPMVSPGYTAFGLILPFTVPGRLAPGDYFMFVYALATISNVFSLCGLFAIFLLRLRIHVSVSVQWRRQIYKRINTIKSGAYDWRTLRCVRGDPFLLTQSNPRARDGGKNRQLGEIQSELNWKRFN